MALGIGATTAIFSVVYAVLIEPYPYRAADRIGQLVISSKKDSWRGINYSKAQYLELKSRLHSMEGAAVADSSEVVMTGTGLPEVVRREYCSPNSFDFFGVPLLLGRAFAAKDSGGGAPGHDPANRTANWKFLVDPRLQPVIAGATTPAISESVLRYPMLWPTREAGACLERCARATECRIKQPGFPARSVRPTYIVFTTHDTLIDTRTNVVVVGSAQEAVNRIHTIAARAAESVHQLMSMPARKVSSSSWSPLAPWCARGFS